MGELDSFAAEIDALGRQIRAEVGAEDLRQLRGLKWLSRVAEGVGRATLHLSFEPLGWSFAVAVLTLHLGLEAQLNHAIQHGTYAGLEGGERFARDRYETLALPMQTATWRKAHRIHHRHPSVVGDDPDTIHPTFRVHPATRWRPWHLLNTMVGTIAVFTCWARDYDRFLKARGKRAEGDRGELRKVLCFVAYQLVLFPLLAWEKAPWVLAGNLVAILARNAIFVALQTGSSVGENVSTRHAEGGVDPRDKGAYLRFQVETSKNFRSPAWWTFLSGGLDRHIEHHLFPRLPAMRLRRVSPRVREICERHGVRYEEYPSMWHSLADSFRHLLRLSLPGTLEAPGTRGSS